MKKIGLKKAAGVFSDNTGNTRKARRLIRKSVPLIVDLQDVCHLLGVPADQMVSDHPVRWICNHRYRLGHHFALDPWMTI